MKRFSRLGVFAEAEFRHVEMRIADEGFLVLMPDGVGGTLNDQEA